VRVESETKKNIGISPKTIEVTKKICKCKKKDKEFKLLWVVKMMGNFDHKRHE
jgi:hypothetical protein